MKRILITGAAGFIGMHCLPLLSEKGYEIHALDKNSCEDSSEATWHCADLLDQRNVTNLLSEIRPTHLLHFAWFTEHGKYWSSPENMRWVQASLSLFQEFARFGGERIVVAGTCGEYDWRYGTCTEDLTPLNPTTLYGTCKYALHLMLRAFANETGLNATWARLFFLYGPREHPDRLVSSVIRSLLQEKPALCSHGNQIRDFLYVRDAAAAFVALMDSSFSGTVNIASGMPIAIKDLVLKVADKLGRANLVRFGAIHSQENEPPILVADINRLTREVGWVPGYDLETGLSHTIEWWKTNIQCDIRPRQEKE
ncbi:MAG: NAD(P)-dependent oxidoreductase [Candidatus Abyssubacteria bacterium]